MVARDQPGVVVKTKEKDGSSNSTRRVNMNYMPGNRILSAMKDAGFKKVTG